jgi:Uma2 family endonuclease
MSVITQPPPMRTMPDAESTPPAQSESSPSLADRLYRFTLDEYHKLAEAEILGDTRVELIEGLLVAKLRKKPLHVMATDLLAGLLHKLMPAGWYVTMQNSITLAESNSEPEPDAKVVRGTPRDYANRIAGPGDVGLVVEVSDTSLRDDQNVKKKVYAKSAVPVYWIVNIPARRIEVYTDPTGPDPTPDYRHRADHGSEDQVTLILDGREIARIAVADLLP